MNQHTSQLALPGGPDTATDSLHVAAVSSGSCHAVFGIEQRDAAAARDFDGEVTTAPGEPVDVDVTCVREQACSQPELKWVGQRHRRSGRPAALAAVLSDLAGNPVKGEQIDFWLGSTLVCSATTDGDGLAKCRIPTGSLALGFYVVTARFTGAPGLPPAEVSVPFHVRPATT